MLHKRVIMFALAALLGAALFSTWGTNSAEAAQRYQTRLAVGDYAEVLPDGASNVRARPGLRGRRLGQAQVGNVLYVMDGPRTANNMLWWYIEDLYTGLQGWVSEGGRGGYYLGPWDGGTGGRGTPSGLAVDDLAFVLDAPDNIVRRNPDMDSRVVGRFPEGAVLEILSGPVFADGMWWWQAYSRSEDVFGWTPEGQSGELFLAPYFGVKWCANSARTRLFGNDRAYVLSNGTGANYLRGYSDIYAVIIGRIQPHATMTIIDGPVCDEENGIVWWEVMPDANPRLRGWTAESEALNYYLAPLTLR